MKSIICFILIGIATSFGGPMVFATGGGGGVHNCGWNVTIESCGGGLSFRERCDLIPGGENTNCTIKNCDGTVIVMPPASSYSGCGNGGL